MTDERAGENFDLVRAIIAQASCNEGMTLNAGDVAFLAKVMESTPAPSIVGGSDERAREVSATLLGEVMQDAWGEICDDADAHPSDMKHGEGTVLFYSPGHWTHLIALRLNERLAALAASRPTDAGAGTSAENAQVATINAVFAENINEQASRLGVHPVETESPGWWQQRVRKAAILAVLATPKPPVDEEARWPIERPASADIDVSGTAAIGISAADINSADDWLVRNLTGDGAGA